MQKNSSIHKLIQQILGSHALNDHAHFWPGPPKNHWNNFFLSRICTNTKKSVHSINSFLRYSQFQSPMTRPTTPFFDHVHPKIFDQLLIYVNLYQHAKNLRNPDFWIKKSCNLIGWEYFGPYLRHKNVLKYGICAGTQQYTFSLYNKFSKK